jgi:hypothetical protein
MGHCDGLVLKIVPYLMLDLRCVYHLAQIQTLKKLKQHKYKQHEHTIPTPKQILTPFLSTVPLQVLVLERCGLTDDSLTCVTGILKAQEAILDSLYWNATLRIYPS